MKKLKTAFANPLFSGSLLMIIGSLGASFFSYLYHLIMGKMLGPESYGIIAAILTLAGLIGLLPASLGLVVTKFISSSQTDQDKKNFITYFYRRVVIIGIIFVILLVFLAPIIGTFLHINQTAYLVISFLMFLFFIPTMFLRAALQGLLKFKEYVISFTLENFAKVSIATLLVLLGFKITGAVSSLVLGCFVGFIFAYIYLKRFIKKHERTTTFNLKPVAIYAMPVLIQSLATTSMYSTDLLLVKHFFSSFDAGIYAALSFLGRIIFFGASPIAAAMFPIVAKRHTEGQSYKKLLFYSMTATLILSFGILLIYGLFPKLALGLLYSSAYLTGAGSLFIFGIFITIFTLSYLLLNFYLAIGRIKVVIIPVVTAVVQIVGIILFHNTLEMVIEVSLFSSLMLFISLVIYYILAKI